MNILPLFLSVPNCRAEWRCFEAQNVSLRNVSRQKSRTVLTVGNIILRLIFIKGMHLLKRLPRT